MKRSVINANIEWAMDLCKRMNFRFQDFFYWTPEEWEAKKDLTERYDFCRSWMGRNRLRQRRF